MNIIQPLSTVQVCVSWAVKWQGGSHTNHSWWHQCSTGTSGTQGSVTAHSLHQRCCKLGQCWKQTFSPGICSHLFTFFVFSFLIFVLIILLDNDIVRCHYLPVGHTYRTVLLLSCKSCESKNLFNIFNCNQIH